MSRIAFVLKMTIVAFPFFGMLTIGFIIYNDEFLSRHMISTVILTALFGSTCLLFTLSKICVLRRKSPEKKKTFHQLCDWDLAYENETEVVPYSKLSFHFKRIGSTLKNIILKNPLNFCKFRPAYGMFLVTGIAFVCVFVAALTQIKEWNANDDFYCVAAEVSFPMILMLSLVYFIANSGIYIAGRDSDLYTPFEEFIQVPMKAFIGKTVAIFVTARTTRWLLLALTICTMALSIVTSNLYHTLGMDDMFKSVWTPVYPEPQRIVKAFFIIMSVLAVNWIIETLLVSFLDAKKSILAVIEKNFQRNLVAINLLLPNTEPETLSDLKKALDRKMGQLLTEKEIAAFNYLTCPIWRTKRPFMLRMFEEDAPESESSDNQLPGEFDHVESTHVQQPGETGVIGAERVLAGQLHGSVMDEKSSKQLGEASLLVESKFGEPSTSAASA